MKTSSGSLIDRINQYNRLNSFSFFMHPWFDDAYWSHLEDFLDRKEKEYRENARCGICHKDIKDVLIDTNQIENDKESTE